MLKSDDDESNAMTKSRRQLFTRILLLTLFPRLSEGTIGNSQSHPPSQTSCNKVSELNDSASQHNIKKACRTMDSIHDPIMARKMPAFEEQLDRARTADGFLAALDQSGGSTPKALRQYGISDDDYVEGETSMYDVIHAMRTRMITSTAFTGDRILGAILFENTMDREIEGKSTSQYLWEEKKVIPFLKIDKGLAPEENGVQVMKPMPTLNELLKKANDNGIFGTKMRSVIKSANADGIQALVDQQFEVGKKIIAAGMVPILEPEVDITSPEKAEIEIILKEKILASLEKLGEKEEVMLKLSLPSVENHYKEFVDHPKVVRLVALSGGYPRDEANEILSKQDGMIASFSRALSQDLSFALSDDEYNKIYNESIESIYRASKKN